MSYLFPGSGNPRPDGLRCLREKIEYLEGLKESILELHRQGLPPELISRRLFGREMLFSKLTGGDFSSLNLVINFIQDYGGEK